MQRHTDDFRELKAGNNANIVTKKAQKMNWLHWLQTFEKYA